MVGLASQRGRAACKLLIVVALLLTTFALTPRLNISAKNLSGAASPVWSPDGKNIAYVMMEQNRQDLYIMSLDSESPVLLVQNGSDPAWSPDGKQIAFTRYTSDSELIFIYTIQSRAMTTLTMGYSPKWSPDGKNIAYLVAGVIHMAPADGSTPRRMITDLALNVLDFSWSPDGNKIAFSAAGKTDNSSALYIMSPDGTNVTKIADGTYNISFAWSPDSQHLAFVGICNAQAADYICTINADGSKPHALFAYLGIQPVRLAWSPDGQQLLYTFGGQVCLIRPDGSHRQCLTEVQAYSNDIDVSWSPDGSQIVFVRMDVPRSAATESDFNLHSVLFIMDADGSNLRNVSEGSGAF